MTLNKQKPAVPIQVREITKFPLDSATLRTKMTETNGLFDFWLLRVIFFCGGEEGKDSPKSRNNDIFY